MLPTGRAASHYILIHTNLIGKMSLEISSEDDRKKAPIRRQLFTVPSLSFAQFLLSFSSVEGDLLNT